MKKVLVTGATGFIGNHIINSLLKEEVEVIATSNKPISELKEFTWISKLTYVQQDLNEEKLNYFEIFHKPDILIHLAWQGLPNYNKSFHLDKNLISNYTFLNTMINSGLKNLTVIGTCFEYGLQEGNLHEEMNTKPINPYGQAKDQLRKQLQELQNTKEFNLNWLRLFYVYGLGQNPNSLLSSLERALENGDSTFNMSPGDQIRDFIHISEVVDIITKIALQNKNHGIINCCSGQPITVKEMVKQYLRDKGQDIKLNLGYYPYSENEAFAFWGDRSKLDKILKEE